MHARYCPVYRSLEAAIQITTDYTLTVGGWRLTVDGCASVVFLMVTFPHGE